MVGKDVRSDSTSAMEESWVEETESSKRTAMLEPGNSVSIGSYRSVCVRCSGGRNDGRSSLKRNIHSGTTALCTARHKSSRDRVRAESTGESPPPYKKTGHKRSNSEGVTMNVLSSSSMMNRSSSGLVNGSQLENKQVSGSMDITKKKKKKDTGLSDHQTASISSRRKKSVPLRGAQVVRLDACNLATSRYS